MRTSLNEIKEIERYLLNFLEATEREAFEARMQHDVKLRVNVFLQKKLNYIFKTQSREVQRRQLELIHDELFQKPAHFTFQRKIFDLFKS